MSPPNPPTLAPKMCGFSVPSGKYCLEIESTKTVLVDCLDAQFHGSRPQGPRRNKRNILCCCKSSRTYDAQAFVSYFKSNDNMFRTS